MSSLAVQAQFEAALTPMGAELVGALAGDGWGVEAQVAFGKLTLVAPREHIVEVMTALRDRFGFQQLLDVCGADYPDREERFEVVYHLLDRGANPNVADNNKLTPLFWAVRMRRPELVTALLNKGADITVRDSRGKDVFEYAKDDVVLEILRSHEKK